jgi:hypothetical protein
VIKVIFHEKKGDELITRQACHHYSYSLLTTNISTNTAGKIRGQMNFSNASSYEENKLSTYKNILIESDIFP